MNNIDINDKRTIDKFKGITFSKFQKSKVVCEILKCLSTSKVEAACYWTAELVCAGHFAEIWEIIILFVSRYIHLGNPKLPIYISMRFANFKEIILNYSGNELALRNNMKIRLLFSEIICLLCYSRKKHSLEPIKIQKKDEFNMSVMSSRLKAPAITYVKDIFQPNDPTELYIAMNEFAYHVSSESKNNVSACYWLEWLLEYETLCQKKKEKCVGENRTIAKVEDKYKNDIIWILWEIIMVDCGKRDNKILTKINQSLLEMFSIKYSASVKRKRKFLLYFAISTLTEPIDYTVEIIKNKTELDAIISKVKGVYKEVKKNEELPDMDYMYAGIERTNLDKTIERLEKMNSIMKV
jgi:hypothetical protein